MRLVGHCAKKFLSSGVEWEELCACGNLGLVKAAATFLPEKSTNFSTYAGRCIDNEINMLLRKRRKHSIVTNSLDDELAGTDGIRLHDVLSDDTDWAEVAERKSLVSDVIKVISMMPKQKRLIWELYYGIGGELPLTQKEIADRLGVSRAQVYKILKIIPKGIEAIRMHD